MVDNIPAVVTVGALLESRFHRFGEPPPPMQFGCEKPERVINNEFGLPAPIRCRSLSVHVLGHISGENLFWMRL